MVIKINVQIIIFECSNHTDQLLIFFNMFDIFYILWAIDVYHIYLRTGIRTFDTRGIQTFDTLANYTNIYEI